MVTTLRRPLHLGRPLRRNPRGGTGPPGPRGPPGPVGGPDAPATPCRRRPPLGRSICSPRDRSPSSFRALPRRRREGRRSSPGRRPLTITRTYQPWNSRRCRLPLNSQVGGTFSYRRLKTRPAVGPPPCPGPDRGAGSSGCLVAGLPGCRVGPRRSLAGLPGGARAGRSPAPARVTPVLPGRPQSRGTVVKRERHGCRIVRDESHPPIHACEGGTFDLPGVCFRAGHKPGLSRSLRLNRENCRPGYFGQVSSALSQK